MAKTRKSKRGKKASSSASSASPRPASQVLDERISSLSAPQPIERLASLRVLAPLAILGFLSSRLAHADHWLGRSGFGVPSLGYTRRGRQPLYVPRLPNGLAWAIAAAIAVSGLALSVGAFTRVVAPLFFVGLAFVSLADRLASFTVNKLGTMIALGLALTPCGARYSIDAWRAQRRAPDKERPTHVTWGNVRFFQALLISLYFTSGIVKARGDWLDNGYVLWTHLHDSYQTSVSHFLANLLPARFWTAAQVATLVFEIGAPLLFGLRRTRSAALLYGLALHVMIGLCFGPVVYFALLMMALLLSGFAPLSWLSLLLRPFERPAPKKTAAEEKAKDAAEEKAKAAADDKPAEAS